MSHCLHDCAELGDHRDCDLHMGRTQEQSDLERDRDEWIQVSRDWRARAERAEQQVRDIEARVAEALRYLDNAWRGATYREQKALEALRGH